MIQSSAMDMKSDDKPKVLFYDDFSSVLQSWGHWGWMLRAQKKTQVILQSLSPRSRLLLAILASNMWIRVRKTIHTITPRYLVSHNKCCASWKTQNMPCGGEYRSIRSHKTVGWIIGSLEKHLLLRSFRRSYLCWIQPPGCGSIW